MTSTTRAPRGPDAPRPSLAVPRRRALLGAGALAAAALGVAGLVALAPRLGPAGTTPTMAVATPPAAETPVVATAPPVAEPAMPDHGAPPATPSAFAGIAEPAPTPTPRSGLLTYTVQAGDVLWQLAERFQLRAETILWANDIDDPDLLLAGQALLIPPTDGVLYTVRPGERLAEVATRYGVELPSIVSANGLADPDQVQAGVDVFLPNGRPLRPAPALAAATAEATTAQAPAGGEQHAVAAIPPVPLPDNIQQLLTAGWLGTGRAAALYRAPDRDARSLQELPAGSRLERLEGFSGGRVQVRSPGDGKTRQAMTGWVDASDLVVGRAPAAQALPLSYPAAAAMDIAHVFAPYRSQLDGTPYAQANCGPTTIGMALGTFGVSVSSRQLRAEALNAQRMWGNDVGTLITALADVVRQHGLRTLDLTGAGGGVRRWSLDDIRAHVGQGHPVVVQVRYRALPGRGTAPYYGDHYILLTGLLGDGRFLYNDSIDADGLGWDRVLAPDRLWAAMDASDKRYAFAAFAVAR